MICSSHGIESLKLGHAVQQWNLPPAALIEAAICRQEGSLTNRGPFLAITVPYTGRSPQDRFVVREATTSAQVWWGPVNAPLAPDAFERLKADVLEYLGQQELFVRDVHANADPTHRLRVRLITESAWHSLFVHNMFLQPAAAELEDFEPDFTILHAPRMQSNPERHATRSGAAIVLNLEQRTIVIVGTHYAGEIKKSVFSVLNYLLPQAGVLSMHCSANVGRHGDVAIFFGLSGTGKTTLSSDSRRSLIGDDEHGWSDSGIFNCEGGCYAKVIRLSAEAEPEIYGTLDRSGVIVENVDLDPQTREMDLDSEKYTENTRASYPICLIPNYVETGLGGHPRNVVFLAADAFGVLPPISRLTPDQAMYHFLSGYTAKLAGTERGVTEPEATFSACFGAPFLVLDPTVYAEMLGERLRRHATAAWLVNTGWTGGPYGVGARMKIAHTRAMVNAALDGSLAAVRMIEDQVFGLRIPVECPGVAPEVINPRQAWADASAYEDQARRLAERFVMNFQQFSDRVSPQIVAAGPKLDRG